MKNKIINIEMYTDREREQQIAFTYNDLVNLRKEIDFAIGLYEKKQAAFNEYELTYLEYSIEGDKDMEDIKTDIEIRIEELIKDRKDLVEENRFLRNDPIFNGAERAMENQVTINKIEKEIERLEDQKSDDNDNDNESNINDNKLSNKINYLNYLIRDTKDEIGCIESDIEGFKEEDFYTEKGELNYEGRLSIDLIIAKGKLELLESTIKKLEKGE